MICSLYSSYKRYKINNFFHIFLVVILVNVVIQFIFIGDVRAQNWRTASREPVGLAPDPTLAPEALIQIYGARAFSWRGYFGIHTWVAVKPTDALSYTVYEVIGWRRRWKQPVLVIHNRAPDRRWYGNYPTVLAEKRGAGVDALIARIGEVVRVYPYSQQYTVWPGPNSNTFTAWVSRLVPELKLDLPPTAIGKDYLGDKFIGLPPSGSGFQFSFYGLLGALTSHVEGIEINLLGLTFGIDHDPFAIKLPMVGRVDLFSQRANATEKGIERKLNSRLQQ